MSGPAPAAPAAYRLRFTKFQLWDLVVDRTMELDWVPELPPADSKAWNFSCNHGAYTLEWWPPSLPRFRFYVTFLGSRVHLIAEKYDYWMPLNRKVYTIPLNYLSRRGLLASAGGVERE